MQPHTHVTWGCMRPTCPPTCSQERVAFPAPSSVAYSFTNSPALEFVQPWRLRSFWSLVSWRFCCLSVSSTFRPPKMKSTRSKSWEQFQRCREKTGMGWSSFMHRGAAIASAWFRSMPQLRLCWRRSMIRVLHIYNFIFKLQEYGFKWVQVLLHTLLCLS